MSRVHAGFSFLFLLCSPTVPAQNPLELPLLWVENVGQWSENIACRTMGGRHAAELWRDRFRVRIVEPRGASSWLELMLPAHAVAVVGEDPITKVSFFRGRDRARWHGGVTASARARAAAVLPGIDLVLRQGAGGIRYDLEVAPGADLEAMTMRVADADRLAVDAGGQLVMHGPWGSIGQTAPVAWQLHPDGTREAVDCRFEVVGAQSYRFCADGWRTELPLVIDPTVAERHPPARHARRRFRGG